MLRLRWALAVALAAACVVAPSAAAHPGNPNYRSVLHGVSPDIPGVQLSVLGYDTQLQLVNKSGKTITILGYGGEPYARILGNGTVETNHNSPAYYLNQDLLGTTPVPKHATSSARPDWHVEQKTGRFIWHDHRMHWMGKNLPAVVKDKKKKTKVFDYVIPLRVGATKAKAHGTLFWVGRPSGIGAAAVISFIVIALLLLALVVVVRRRRRGGVAAGRPAKETQEAW
ncbi:MAG TPA: hypothetical protein VGF21_12490 [Thermoleophilaceae bacterium]|jgi:hypothetical protein